MLFRSDVADTIALIPDAVIRAVYVRTCAGKFEIDEQILADRVNRSRSEAIKAEQQQVMRAEERASVSGQMVPPPEMYPPDVLPSDVFPPAIGFVVENGPLQMNEPFLEPCEREILGFILEDGCTHLQFDRDSKYYTGGEIMTVADFVDGVLAEDDAEFANIPYRKAYEEFFRMYEEGLSQEQIQTRLLNSMDEVISAVAKDLLIEKHQITVKNYEQSLTSTSTRLVQFIPKAMLAYQCRKVELIQKGLMAELGGIVDDERQMEILSKISEYNKVLRRLNKELGRE